MVFDKNHQPHRRRRHIQKRLNSTAVPKLVEGADDLEISNRTSSDNGYEYQRRSIGTIDYNDVDPHEMLLSKTDDFDDARVPHPQLDSSSFVLPKTRRVMMVEEDGNKNLSATMTTTVQSSEPAETTTTTTINNLMLIDSLWPSSKNRHQTPSSSTLASFFSPTTTTTRTSLSSSFPMLIRLLLLSLLCCDTTVVSGRRLPDVYWNSSNPIFRVDNTDHVMGVEIRDFVSFICPYYDSDYNGGRPEYSQIYRVSRWGYENCQLSKDARLVGVCRTPFKTNKIKVVFREFTPVPGGLEYHPGLSYYFVSTSNGTEGGISNTHGGLCQSANVKLKIEIMPSKKFGGGTNPVWKGKGGRSSPPQNPRSPSSRSGVREDSSRNVNHSPQQQSQPVTPPSPTPLMYEIHTRSPEEEAALKVTDNQKDDDDDGGAASSQQFSKTLVILLLLITIYFP